MEQKNRRISTRQLVSMAMLGAISIVLVAVIHFPLIPAAAFLEYDPADIPILICAFAYGPLAGLLLTVVVCFIQGFTDSWRRREAIFLWMIYLCRNFSPDLSTRQILLA